MVHENPLACRIFLDPMIVPNPPTCRHITQLELRASKAMNGFSGRAGFIWSIADLLHDSFKRGQYEDKLPDHTQP